MRPDGKGAGNVWEWEDACNGSAGATDECLKRGGSFTYKGDYLACGWGPTTHSAREFAVNTGGIRCCSAP